MAAIQVLSVLAVRCVDCGDPERLVTVTAATVTSRCYVCGDIDVKERSAPPVAAGPAKRRAGLVAA